MVKFSCANVCAGFSPVFFMVVGPPYFVGGVKGSIKMVKSLCAHDFSRESDFCILLTQYA